MTGTPQGSGADDEAHLAALLAVLSVLRADPAPAGTPLRDWRARRLAALRSTRPGSERSTRR